MKSRPEQLDEGATLRDAPAHAGVVVLPRVTALRFFAALWVLCFHALPRHGSSSAWTAVWDLGWLGVTFFFVLSGFILTYTYARAGAAIDRARFWFARVARVYPLYLFALVFAVPSLAHDIRRAAATGDPIGAQRIAGAVVTTVAMLQAWFSGFVCLWDCPSWSLSDEAFFYALFPLLVPLATHRRGRSILVALTALGIMLVTWNGASGPAQGIIGLAANTPLNPLLRLPEFLVGVCVGAFFLDRRPQWSAATSAALTATATGLILAFAVLAGSRTIRGPLQLEAAPLFAVVILAVAASRTPSRGWLAAAPLVLLGEASYALYMLHGPLHGYALAAFNRVTPSMPDGARFVVYTVLAVALAIGCFVWLERPARRRLRTWFDRAFPVTASR